VLETESRGASVLYRAGAQGPNFGVTSACAVGSHAIGEALNTIRRGDADMMIAGGSEAAITPVSFAGFCAMKAMCTKVNLSTTHTHTHTHTRLLAPLEILLCPLYTTGLRHCSPQPRVLNLEP